MNKKQKDLGLGSIEGTALLGERGQIVIPKTTRDRLKLKAGDGFLVIEHFGKIVLVPKKAAVDFVNHITKEFGKLNKIK